MKTAPITPAAIDFDADGVPFAPAFGDRYHARAGALGQAEHVFLRGNGLPQRWGARARFVILETGFGLGLNFLATWAAWRRDAARCDRLHYVAIDLHPPTRADLARVHAAVLGGDAGGGDRHSGGNGGDGESAASAPMAPLAAQLRDAWPPLTGDLHRLAFDGGRVELLLAFGDAASWLRRLQLRADAIYLDGFAPEHNAAMWSEALFAALPPLCAAGATAATWSVARPVADGLAQHGFEVERAPGFAGKREMTVARFAPRHRAAPSPRRQSAMPSAREALVVGAGIAGATVARALAGQGLAVTVLEAAPAAATGGSGNMAGLARCLVARDDGAHARWHRAAALQAQREIAPLVGDGSSAGVIAGHLGGVLHLADDVHDMRRRAAAAAWPAELVQALDGEAAAALAGVPGLGPAWFFPGGGWVDPSTLVRHLLGGAGAAVACSHRGDGGPDAPSVLDLRGAITLRTGCRVERLQRRGSRWLACDERGVPLAEADVVVLANAADAARLAPGAADVGSAANATAAAPYAWRVGRTRGQVTRLSAADLRDAGLPQPPLLPLARNGYLIPLPDGGALCGATQTSDDDDPALRDADHAHNLAVLRRLTRASRPAAPGAASDLSALDGRVGWRWHTDDRLPLIGALPLRDGAPGTAHALASRLAQPRHVPRDAGLFVLAALGSRGITSAALAAHVLAAWICDPPMPVDTDLLDAVDAARYVSRAARRGPRAL
ncbi:MAG: tRNA (5-methylaminomethyl-2-thiouridine)(34)-methyltransferase MnmD [Betaproteobacteria bacterium]|nr:tRNA (5-methylaminomethyl-2-thiouridine)(34)-methyltransferase MnmD [Betaproteobacteria bacterium]